MKRFFKKMGGSKAKHDSNDENVDPNANTDTVPNNAEIIEKTEVEPVKIEEEAPLKVEADPAESGAVTELQPADEEPKSEEIKAPPTGNIKKSGGEAFEIDFNAQSDKPKPEGNQNHSDSEEEEVVIKREVAAITDESTEEEIEESTVATCKEMFGHDVAYNLGSAQWANRKEGIEVINQKVLDLKTPIQEGTNIDPEELKQKFIVTMILTRRALKDKVTPVCFSAYELHRNAVKVFCPILDSSASIKNACASLVGPFLLKMSGEKNRNK